MTQLKFRISDDDYDDYKSYDIIFNKNCFIMLNTSELAVCRKGIYIRYYSKQFRRLRDFSSIRKLIKLRKLELEVFDE